MEILEQEIVINSSPLVRTVALYWRQSGVNPSGNIFANQVLPIREIVISGEHTLAGSVSITPGSDAEKHMKIIFLYRAELITNTAEGRTFSVFGFNFSDEQATKKGRVECYYNGSTWEATYFPDFREDEVVSGNNLVDGSVTEPKLADDSVSPRTIQDNAITAPAFSDDSIPTRAFAEQSVPNTAIQDKSIGRIKIGDHEVTNEIQGLMAPGTVKVGGGADEGEAWLPVDEQMNTPGPGSLLIAQGYGKRAKSRQIIHQGQITEGGLFYIRPGAVTLENMGTYAVDASKADDTMVSEIIPRDIDFAVAGDYKIKMAYKGYVFGITIYVDSTITGSNGLIEVLNDDDTVMTTFNVNTGGTIGLSYNNAVGANNEFDKFDTIKFRVSGASGGKMHADMIVVKRP